MFYPPCCGQKENGYFFLVVERRKINLEPQYLTKNYREKVNREKIKATYVTTNLYGGNLICAFISTYMCFVVRYKFSEHKLNVKHIYMYIYKFADVSNSYYSYLTTY